jgi:uncharacterized membrane protein YqjE
MTESDVQTTRKWHAPCTQKEEQVPSHHRPLQRRTMAAPFHVIQVYPPFTMSPLSFSLSPSKEGNLSESVRSFMNATLHYLETRWCLLCQEGGDMLHRGLLMAILGTTALVGAFFTYAGMMVALVLWIARTWWSDDPLPAIIIVALGHMVLTLACAGWLIHLARHTQIFHATLRELKEDRVWLNTKETSRS